MKKQKQNSENPRELALEALLAVEKGEEYSHVVISGMLDKYNYLEAREKAFIKRLTEGTLERRIQLDYCIDACASLPTRKMKPFVRELLRMSVYQILFMDSVPDSAACNEAVKLAQRHSFHSLKGFVNGVLRSVSRQKGQIVYPDRETERLSFLSVRYSMPVWLIEKWDEEQGRERTEQILQGLLEERPVTVRLKSGMSEVEKRRIIEELTDKGVTVRECPELPFALYLERTEGMKNIPSFLAGKFYVQDISSMLSVLAAGIREGDFVIDVCAAPGGKMLFASELTGSGGSVLARDISERKLTAMRENRDRMRADNITLEQWDAAVCDEKRCGSADVVLADVPCSGLGVIGKKRDIKYRVTKEQIEGLLPLQKQILESVQRYVKPGGVLLYSTCTISRAENESTVRWFLESFPFHAESLTPFLPARFAGETAEKGYVQLLPGVHGTDGFFMARLVRNCE